MTEGNRDARDHPANGRVFLGFSGLYAHVGDLVGHFYQTRDDWYAILIAFLKAGLEAGDQCIYLLDPHHQHWQELRMALGHAQINVEDVLASGQLVLDVGKATPEPIRVWLPRMRTAHAGRYRRLRWGGDLAWILRKYSIDDWRRELATVSDLIKELPVVGLCQYDLTQLPGSVVMNALEAYPLCIVRDLISRSPRYLHR